MTNIFDVYNFFLRLAATGKGFVPPNEASSWIEAAQMDTFNGYRALSPLDNRTQDLLAPFIKYPDFAFTSNAVGNVTLPADYVQAVRVVNSGGKEHTPVLFNELRDALSSALEPISDYPRYGEGGNYIMLYPRRLTSGTLTYYRMPKAPVIGYTTDADGKPVYDPTTSVELEIPKAFWFEVIRRALVYIGINLSDADLFALSQNDKG